MDDVDVIEWRGNNDENRPTMWMKGRENLPYWIAKLPKGWVVQNHMTAPRTNLAGPFDTLEAAKTAYLLITS